MLFRIVCSVQGPQARGVTAVDSPLTTDRHHYGLLDQHSDLYVTTHNTHNRETSMLSALFEPTASAGERPQIYALDRAATGTGFRGILKHQIR